MNAPETLDRLHRQIERLRQERDELQKERDQYHALFNASMDAIFLTAPDGRIFRANQAACQLFQMSEEELITAGRSVIYAGNGEHLQKALDERSKTGRFRGRLNHRKKDGTLFPGDVSSVIYTTWQGEPRTCTIIRDASVASRYEEDLQKALDKYRTLFEAFPLGITVSDSDGNIVETNPEAERLLGISKNDHEGRDIDGAEWRILRPDGSDMPSEEWASVIALNEQRRVDHREMGVAKPGAETVWIDVTAAPLPGPGKGVIVTYTDISERRRAEAALAESRHRNRVLLETIPDLMFVLSRDGRILDFQANDRADLVLEPDQVIGSMITDTMQEDVCAKVLLSMATALDEDCLQIIEYCLPVKRGHQDFEARITPLTDNTVLAIVRNITEQKQDQEALRQSEARFRQFFENAGAYCYLVSPEGTILEVNSTAIEALGYDRESLIGRPVSELYAEESRDVARQSFDQWKRTGCVRNAELVVKTRSGQRRKVVLNVDAVRNERGEIVHSTSIHTDVTDISSLQQQFQTIYDEAPIGIAISTLNDPKIIQANAGYCRIVGYDANEIVGKSLQDLTCPEDWVEECRYVTSIIENADDHFQLKKRYVRKDGTFRWVNVNGKLIDAFSGLEQRVAIATVEDVTEIKHAEEALKTSQIELRERNQILSAILEHTHMMAVYLDAAFNFIWVNQAYAGTCRQPRDFFIGKNHFEIYPDAANQAIFQRVVDSNKSVYIEAKPFEFPDQPQRGITYWDWSLVPVLDSSGQTKGLVFTLVDVTQKIKAEQSLRRNEEKLRQSQKLEAVGTLSGGIAHEFNNILSIIVGNAELAVEDVAEDLQLHEFVKEIIAAGLRGKKVVEELLAFSRPTPVQMKPLDVAVTVTKALGFLKSTIPSTIDLQTRLEADCPPVLGDTTQIHQVLVNLCNNAVQAMDEQCGRLDVSLSKMADEKNGYLEEAGLPPGSYLCLDVSDDGKGIPAEILDRVFEPFFSTKPVGLGSGLGLSVVHGIVNGHGGAVRILSHPGEGTTVRCFFPLMDEIEAVPPRDIRSAAAGGKEGIVVIDDERAIVKMTGIQLQRLGYRVETFTDPTVAVEWIEQNPDRVDVVITDLTMPKLRGDRLIASLRRRQPGILLILSTGYQDKIDSHKAAQMGADALLIKPYGKNKLSTAIRKVLDLEK